MVRQAVRCDAKGVRCWSTAHQDHWSPTRIVVQIITSSAVPCKTESRCLKWSRPRQLHSRNSKLQVHHRAINQAKPWTSKTPNKRWCNKRQLLRNSNSRMARVIIGESPTKTAPQVAKRLLYLSIIRKEEEEVIVLDAVRRLQVVVEVVLICRKQLRQQQIIFSLMFQLLLEATAGKTTYRQPLSSSRVRR